MKKVVMLLLCGSLLYGCSSSQYSVKVSDHEDALVTGSELNITKQDYFEYLLQNYGAQTVVSSMLDKIADQEITDQDKIDQLVKEREDEVLSEDEIPKVVEFLKSDPTVWNLGVLLILQTGLRVGELSGLKREDWHGDVLKVRRHEVRLKDADGKNIVCVRELAKTEAGVRDIVLSDGGKETLSRLVNRNPNGTYLFENSSGKRIRGNTFNKRLDTVLKKLNMHHRSIHKLRKTYCTMLIDAGCEDAVIMNQMGHASIETSRKYYYFCNRTKQHQADQIRKAIMI